MSFDINVISENNLHNDPEREIANIQKTFESVIAKDGEDSFNPMLVLFDADYSPKFAVEARPYTSKSDMYVCFAEMLYSFTAFNAHSFMMANDTKFWSIDQNGQKGDKNEALTLAFASNEANCFVLLPYKIENNQVIWQHDKFSIDSSSSREESTGGAMIELYYIMTHVKHSPFSFNTLINYYSFRDFPYHIDPAMIGDKLLVNL